VVGAGGLLGERQPLGRGGRVLGGLVRGLLGGLEGGTGSSSSAMAGGVGELAGRPGADRRPPQARHPSGSLAVSGGAKLAGELVAAGDELAPRQPIQRGQRSIEVGRCGHAGLTPSSTPRSPIGHRRPRTVAPPRRVLSQLLAAGRVLVLRWRNATAAAQSPPCWLVDLRNQA
jgi:hypothetical protein